MVNEPRPRGSHSERMKAAWPRQCYYRPAGTAFAAERQSVGQTGCGRKGDGRGRFAGSSRSRLAGEQAAEALAALVPSCRRVRATVGGVVVATNLSSGIDPGPTASCPTSRCSCRRPSALGRRSTSRGHAARFHSEGKPRGRSSATIDQPGRPSQLNGKALDRLGLWWWRVRTVVGSDHGFAAGAVAARGSGRRGAQLEIVGGTSPAHGTRGLAPEVAAFGISVGGLSNLPLQRTKAVGSRPTVNEPRPRGSY